MVQNAASSMLTCALFRTLVLKRALRITTWPPTPLSTCSNSLSTRMGFSESRSSMFRTSCPRHVSCLAERLLGSTTGAFSTARMLFDAMLLARRTLRRRYSRLQRGVPCGEPSAKAEIVIGFAVEDGADCCPADAVAEQFLGEVDGWRLPGGNVLICGEVDATDVDSQLALEEDRYAGHVERREEYALIAQHSRKRSVR